MSHGLYELTIDDYERALRKLPVPDRLRLTRLAERLVAEVEARQADSPHPSPFGRGMALATLAAAGVWLLDNPKALPRL